MKTAAQRVADHKERLTKSGGRRITVSLPAEAAASLTFVRSGLELPNATEAVSAALVFAGQNVERMRREQKRKR
jgi:hypothetical protein